MNNNIIYALDFDGVICDSAVETGITGWKAATTLWPDMDSPLPPDELIDQFRLVRPIIETGFEAILVMRMLYEGEYIQSIFSDYSAKKEQMIDQSGIDIDGLKQLFGSTRDNWIDNDLPEWINMNPLFTGIAEKLKHLDAQQTWYIVTTKQERFVTHILKAKQIELPGNRVFGLDRKMSKEDVLIDLINQNPDKEIVFVEDRLPTLLNVINNCKLQEVRLFFATWGYNTQEDNIEAARHDIQLIGIEDFLA